MSIKISTLLNKIASLTSKENASIIMDFYKYVQDKGSSENHKVNTLRVVMDYVKYLGNIGPVNLTYYFFIILSMNRLNQFIHVLTYTSFFYKENSHQILQFYLLLLDCSFDYTFLK